MAEKNIDLADIGLLGMLYEQMLQTLSLKEQYFKLAYPFIQWIWPNSPAGTINHNVFILVDEMPADCEYFYRSSGAGLYNSYSDMLAVAPRLTVSPDQELEEAQKKVESAWEDLKATERELKEAWKKEHSENPSRIYGEWVSTSIYKKKNDASLEKYNEAISEKIKAIKGVNQDYTEAMDACRKPEPKQKSKAGFVRSDDTSEKEWYPSYEINNGKIWNDLTKHSFLTQSLGGLKFELAANIPTFSAITTEDSTTGNNSAWVENAAAALMNPNTFTKDSKPDDTSAFFATLGNDGKWQAFNIKTDRNYKVDLNIGEYKFIPINPGAWYDAKYLKKLASKGQWNKPFTTKTPPSPVFGENGILSCRITEMIVGCHVQFNIFLSPEAYQEYVQTFLTSNNIRIGPFRFGPNKQEGEMPWTKFADKQKCILHGETSSSSWFILGFNVETPGL